MPHQVNLRRGQSIRLVDEVAERALQVQYCAVIAFVPNGREAALAPMPPLANALVANGALAFGQAADAKQFFCTTLTRL